MTNFENVTFLPLIASSILLISGNGNLAMAYAETVVNADGTTTLKIVDDVNL